VPELPCLWCGGRVETWQGKDGPNPLLVWRQGNAHPVAQPVADAVQVSAEVRRQFSLPPDFTISGFCVNGHVMHAHCHSEGGVWRTTDLTAEETKVEEKAERDRLKRLRDTGGRKVPIQVGFRVSATSRRRRDGCR
jgi:hypothetical protein